MVWEFLVLLVKPPNSPRQKAEVVVAGEKRMGVLHLCAQRWILRSSGKHYVILFARSQIGSHHRDGCQNHERWQNSCLPRCKLRQTLPKELPQTQGAESYRDSVYRASNLQRSHAFAFQQRGFLSQERKRLKHIHPP